MKKNKYIKRVELFENFSGLLVFLGFIILVGTAGSLEYSGEVDSEINIIQFIIQSIIAVVFMFGGLRLLYFFESIHEKLNRKYL